MSIYWALHLYMCVCVCLCKYERIEWNVRFSLWPVSLQTSNRARASHKVAGTSHGVELRWWVSSNRVRSPSDPGGVLSFYANAI